MTETDRNEKELRRIRRVLKETTRLAREASMTGSLEEGARNCVQQYNGIVSYLEGAGVLPQGLFRPLADETRFDEVGVAAAQLASYLEDEESLDDSGKPRGPNVFIGIGGLKQGLRELKDMKELREVGQYIRDHMPDWLKARVAGTPEPPPEPDPATLEEVEAKMDEAGARLEEVVNELRDESITEEKKKELEAELTKLGQQQAHLSRIHAKLRAGAQEPAASGTPSSGGPTSGG